MAKFFNNLFNNLFLAATILVALQPAGVLALDNTKVPNSQSTSWSIKKIAVYGALAAAVGGVLWLWHSYDNIVAAIQQRALRKLKYRVEHGMNIDEKTDLLLCVVIFDFLDIVKYLVEHGANLDKKDKDGNTARNIALSYDYTAMAEYLALAEDFYLVVANKMEPDNFFKIYGETQDQVANTENLADIRKLLHLGTPEIADKFYDWCKKNNRFAGGDKWARGKAWMYFDLAIGTQKLYWYLFARDAALQDTSEEGKKLRNDMQATYSKSENLPLQKAYLKWVQEKQSKQNLKKLSPQSSSGFDKKQLHDFKIKFKSLKK